MKITQETYDELISYLENNTTRFVKSNQILVNVPEIKNSVNLREMVNHLRTNGNTIVSSSLGYKLSNDYDEIFTCIVNLKHRASQISSAALGMLTSTSTKLI